MFSSFWNALGTLLALGVVACIISLAFTRVMLGILPKFGMIDKPDFARHIHTIAVPRGGGIGMILAFLLSTLVFFSFIADMPKNAYMEFLEFLLPGLILLPLGVLDDRYCLRPRVKLVFQLLAASLAWFLDFRLNHLFGASLPPLLNFILSVFWIVALINAFNMIDGIDGLAGGIGFISATCMIIVALSQKHYAFATMLAAFAAVLLGFLRYNWHPARLFMGDTGSMFIGYVLAVSGLALNARIASVASIGIPLLACGIPVVDVVLAVWRRIMGNNPTQAETTPGQENEAQQANPQGENTILGRTMRILSRLGTADQKHLHHRLLKRYANNQPKTVWCIYLIAISMGLVGISCCFIPGRNLLLALFVILGTFSFIINRLAAIEIWTSTEKLYHDFQSAKAGIIISYIINPLSDLTIIFLSYSFSFEGMSIPWSSILRYLSIIMAILLLSRSYRVFWNMAVLDDYFRLICTCIFAFFITWCLDLLFFNAHTLRLHLDTCTLTVTLVMLERLFLHYFRNSQMRRTCNSSRNIDGLSRTLLYGVSPLCRFYRNNLQAQIKLASTERIIGIIAQSQHFHHSYCFGQQVLGTIEELDAILERTHANKIVITIPIDEATRRTLYDKAAAAGISISQLSLENT